jgi:hypothetical protein
MTNDEAIAYLTQQGLTITESMTTPKRANKKPKPVWHVTGRVEPFRQLLCDQGGTTRFTGRNTFSFWEDPTIDLAELIQCRGEASIEEQVAFKDNRSQARADRYSERASNQHRKSAEAYQRSNDAVEGIPMGQPILAGHSSEAAHRLALDKSHRAMSQSVDATNYAAHLEEKAAGSQNQIQQRHSIEYMGNRLEEANKKKRAALTILKESPENTHYQLELQDAEVAITHWQQAIEASGGMLDASRVKKGDTIKFIGRWYPIVRVNKKSVTIDNWMGRNGCTYVVPYHKIEGHQPRNIP